MRKLLGLAAAILTGCVASASAADMPVKAEPVPVAVGYDWTGWQFGFGIGNAWNRSRFDSVAVAPATTTAHSWNEPRISLHGVHQYQLNKLGLGNLIFGFEYGMSFSVSDRAGVSVCPNPAFNCETTIETVLTSGVRLGWGFNRFMIYGSGGLAWADVSSRFILGGATASFDQQWQRGFYLGGGFDVLVHKGTLIDLVLGAEYQHLDFGTDRHFLVGGAVVPGSTRDVTVRQDIVRAKLTVKFNGPSLW